MAEQDDLVAGFGDYLKRQEQADRDLIAGFDVFRKTGALPKPPEQMGAIERLGNAIPGADRLGTRAVNTFPAVWKGIKMGVSPTQLGGHVARALESGKPSEGINALDTMREQATRDVEAFQQTPEAKNPTLFGDQTVGDVVQNIAPQMPQTLERLVGGAAGAIKGARMGPWGAAAGGIIGALPSLLPAYHESQTRTALAVENAEDQKRAQAGLPPLSLGERQALEQRIEPQTQKIAAAEVGTELPGMALEALPVFGPLAKLGTKPLASAFSKEALKAGGMAALKGMGATALTEPVEEAASTMMQQPIERELGLTDQPAYRMNSGEDWKKAFEEVTGPTLVGMIPQMLLGGGLAGVGTVRGGRQLYERNARLFGNGEEAPPEAIQQGAAALAQQLAARQAAAQGPVDPNQPAPEPLSKDELGTLDFLQRHIDDPAKLANQFGMRLSQPAEAENVPNEPLVAAPPTEPETRRAAVVPPMPGSLANTGTRETPPPPLTEEALPPVEAYADMAEATAPPTDSGPTEPRPGATPPRQGQPTVDEIPDYELAIREREDTRAKPKILERLQNQQDADITQLDQRTFVADAGDGDTLRLKLTADEKSRARRLTEKRLMAADEAAKAQAQSELNAALRPAVQRALDGERPPIRPLTQKEKANASKSQETRQAEAATETAAEVGPGADNRDAASTGAAMEPGGPGAPAPAVDPAEVVRAALAASGPGATAVGGADGVAETAGGERAVAGVPGGADRGALDAGADRAIEQPTVAGGVGTEPAVTEPALSEGQTAEPTLTKVKTLDGNTLHVRQQDLEGDRELLPVFNAKGQRVPGKNSRVHRENLDPTGEKAADAWKDLPSLDGKDGKGYPNEPAARKAIRDISQREEDFQVVRHPDTRRWHAYRKAAEPTPETNEGEAAASSQDVPETDVGSMATPDNPNRPTETPPTTDAPAAPAAESEADGLYAYRGGLKSKDNLLAGRDIYQSMADEAQAELNRIKRSKQEINSERVAALEEKLASRKALVDHINQSLAAGPVESSAAGVSPAALKRTEEQASGNTVSPAQSGANTDTPALLAEAGGTQDESAPAPQPETPAVQPADERVPPTASRPADAVETGGRDGQGAAVEGAVANAPEGLNWVEHTTSKGKTLRGIVRKDLTVQQAKQIDPFTFKKDGGFFIRDKHALAERRDGIEIQHPEFITPAVRKAFREWQASGEDTYFGEDGRRSYSIEDSALHDGLVEFGTTSTRGNARSAGGQKVFENRLFFRKSDLDPLVKDAQPDQFPDAREMVEEAPKPDQFADASKKMETPDAMPSASTERPGADAAATPDQTQTIAQPAPWDAAAQKGEGWKEDRWFQTRVQVAPAMKGDKPWEGTVHSVLKTSDGPLLEVKKDGQTMLVRVRPNRVSILDLKDSAAQTDNTDILSESMPTSPTPEAQQKPKPGRYQPPANDGSVATQRSMADRGGRLAALDALNQQVAKANPTAAYTPDEIQSAADDRIDSMQDWLVSQQKPAEQRLEAERPQQNLTDNTEKLSAQAEGSIHQEPGKPAESTTPAVIKDAIETGLDNTSMTPKQMGEFLSKRVDDLTAEAYEKGKRSLSKEDSESASGGISASTRLGVGTILATPSSTLDSSIGEVVKSDKPVKRQVSQKARAEVAKPAEQEQAASATEDAGEELTYNKRNRIRTGIKWDDIKDKTESLRVKETTKANVYPKPDWETVAQDVDPVIAYLAKNVYDSISTTPATRTPTDADLQTYIGAARRVMDGVMEWIKSAQYESPFKVTANGKTLLDALYPNGWNKGTDAEKAEIRLLGSNKFFSAMQPGYDERAKANREIKKGWPAKQEAWQKQGFKVVSRDEADIYSGRAKGFLVRVAGNYHSEHDTREQAQAVIDALPPWLVTNKRGNIVAQQDSKDAAVNAAREAAKRKGGTDTISDKGIRVTEANRVGPAHRQPGEDITSEQLKETFGFKGVNFGTWMKGKSNEAERQLHLNHAYDSMMDLADLLGVPPKAVSLNGMLGLAIGAQGNGRYAAHFVPGVNEINLTRTSGAGSLGHEWAHALDHYFANQAGLSRTTDPFMTAHVRTGSEKSTMGGDIRPEIVSRFKAIKEAMLKRPLTVEEIEADRAATMQRARNRLNSWINSFNANTKLAEDADYAALMERIRNLDLGDGVVPVGKKYYASPVVAELQKLVKAKHGNYPADQFYGLYQAANYIKHLNESSEASAVHEPQMGRTDYKKAADALDSEKGGKPYWSTPWEMFARAFDAYVSDKIEEKAQRNTYLSHAGRSGDTVPTGTERKAINAAFDALVQAIETKETDQGMAMFSVAAHRELSESGIAKLRRAVNAYKNGRPFPGEWIKLGKTPAVLRMVGAKNLSLEMDPKKLSEAVKPAGKHKLSEGAVVDAIRHLSDPIAILESRSQPGALVAITEVLDQGRPMVVAVHLEPMGMRYAINKIASAYAKDDVSGLIRKTFSDGKKALYVNEDKRQQFGRETRLYLPLSASDLAGVQGKVYDENDLAQYETENNASPAKVEDPHTADSLKKAIDDAEGDGFAGQLEKTGRFNIVTSDQVPGMLGDGSKVDVQKSQDGRVLGFVKDGQIYLVADNISQSENSVQGLLRHEIAVHALQLGKSDAEFQNIVQAFKEMTSDKARAAQARVPQSTADSLRDEEGLGYFIEANPSHPLTRRFIAWMRAALRKFAASIKGADRYKVIQWAQSLTEDDLIYMANQAMRSAPSQLGRANREGILLSGDATESSIDVDGVDRPTTNSNGRLINSTEEGIRNFWRWMNGGMERGQVAGKDSGRQEYGRGRGNNERASAQSLLFDANGRPHVYFHGTSDDVRRFDTNHPNRKDKGWLGRGVYVSNSSELASSYAKRKPGAAAPNVMPVYIALRNPYIADLDFKKMMLGFTQEGIDSITDQLKAAGHDGVILEFGGGTQEIAVFDPRRVKSATGNTGAFSGESDDIRFSRRSDLNNYPDEREGSGIEEDPEARFDEDPQALFAEVDAVIQGTTPVKEAKGELDKRWNQFTGYARRQWLGALTVHQLTEIGKDLMPRMSGYLKEMNAMDVTRNSVLHEVDAISKPWEALSRVDQGRLALVMHESTLAGVDGAEEYTPSIDIKDAGKQIGILQRRMLNAGGDPKISTWMKEVEDLRNQVRFERSRSEAYGQIRALFRGLSPAAKAVYLQARDYHVDQSRRVEQALVEMINQSRLSGRQRAAAIANLRREFESQRVQAPYFPLARQGDYWVSVRAANAKSNDQNAFYTYQTIEEQEAAIKAFKAEGNTIMGRGKQLEGLRDLQGVPVAFVAQVEDLIGQLGDFPAVAEVRDQVYQLYLKSLPDLSARKHFIHRKKTPGFGEDALRAFATKGYHDAYQLARIQHGFAMRQTMEKMKEDLEAASSKGRMAALRRQRALLSEFKDEVLNKGMTTNEVQARAESLSAGMMKENVSAKSPRTQGERFLADEREKWKQFHEWMQDWAKYGDMPNWVEEQLADIATRMDTAQRINRAERGYEKASNLYNELQEAYAHLMNPTTGRWANIINQVGYLWHLAFSPAAWITNATQTPIITMPYVSAKFGMGKTTEAFSRAYLEAMRGAVKGGKEHPLGIREALTRPDEIEAYDAALDMGLIDRGRAMDLAGVAEEGASRSGWHRKFATAMTVGFHDAERLNREVSFMASYRLARADGLSHDAAMTYAGKVINDTHFNYTSENRPRFLRSDIMRVLGQFKLYSQHVTYLQWRALKQALGPDASAEERREARRFLLTQTGVQLMAGGVLGLPLGIWATAAVGAGGMAAAARYGWVGALGYAATVIAAAVALGGDDDDDPREWQAEFQQTMAEWLGSTGGEAASKGLINALAGVDLSTRVSQGELWWRSLDADLDDKELWGEILQQVAGAGLGTGASMIQGLQLAGDGHVERGIEKMVPKATKDVMQALRFTDEGAKTLKGDTLVEDLSPWELGSKAAGFTPSRLAERYDENSAEKRRQRKIEDRRRELVGRVADARIAASKARQAGDLGDVEDAEETASEGMTAIQRFNQMNPGLRITPKTLQQSVKSRNQARMMAQNGVFLNRKLPKQYDYAE